MAEGDLTASTPVNCATEAEIKTAIDALNLAADTDKICIIPHRDSFLVFKIERAAA